MGISCASEILTEANRIRLADLPGQQNMTDDVLVFGMTAEEHQKKLMEVLTRLEDIGLTLNLRKCEFYKEELTFYGLRFSSQGISRGGIFTLFNFKIKN